MPTLTDLPKELLLHTYSALSEWDLLTLARVNSMCYRLSSHPTLWHVLYQKSWKNNDLGLRCQPILHGFFRNSIASSPGWLFFTLDKGRVKISTQEGNSVRLIWGTYLGQSVDPQTRPLKRKSDYRQRVQRDRQCGVFGETSRLAIRKLMYEIIDKLRLFAKTSSNTEEVRFSAPLSDIMLLLSDLFSRIHRLLLAHRLYSENLGTQIAPMPVHCRLLPGDRVESDNTARISIFRLSDPDLYFPLHPRLLHYEEQSEWLLQVAEFLVCASEMSQFVYQQQIQKGALATSAASVATCLGLEKMRDVYSTLRSLVAAEVSV